MWYKIKQGKHRASPLSLGIHFGKTSESYEVMFDESCRYDLIDEDQEDWNKLVGWSYGMHHKNSIRIGWRYNRLLNKIELVVYLYVDSKRISYYLSINDMLEFNKKYTLTLRNDYPLIELDIDGVLKHCTVDRLIPKWGYDLGCYFGGNESSPVNLKVWIKKLKKS